MATILSLTGDDMLRAQTPLSFDVIADTNAHIPAGGKGYYGFTIVIGHASMFAASSGGCILADGTEINLSNLNGTSYLGYRELGHFQQLKIGGGVIHAYKV